MYQEYDYSLTFGWSPIFGVAMIYGGMTFIMDFEDFFWWSVIHFIKNWEELRRSYTKQSKYRQADGHWRRRSLAPEAMVTMIRNFCNGSSGINWRRLLVACESCIDDANHQWLLLLFFISVLMHLPTTTLAPSAPNDYVVVVLYSYLAHSRGKQGVYCTMTY